MIKKHSHISREDPIAVDDVLNDEAETVERIHSGVVKKGDDFVENVFGSSV